MQLFSLYEGPRRGRHRRPPKHRRKDTSVRQLVRGVAIGLAVLAAELLFIGITNHATQSRPKIEVVHGTTRSTYAVLVMSMRRVSQEYPDHRRRTATCKPGPKPCSNGRGYPGNDD